MAEDEENSGTRNTRSKKLTGYSEYDFEKEVLSEYKCGKCGKKVNQATKALQCEVCDEWYHIGCEGIPEEFYEYLTEEGGGEQFHWNCHHCKKGYGKMLGLLQRIDARQMEVMETQKAMGIKLVQLKENAELEKTDKQKLEVRLGSIEVKLLNKPMDSRNNENNVDKSVQECMKKDIIKELKEEQDKEKRKNNVVIFNVVETNQDSQKDRDESDMRLRKNSN